MEIPVTLIVKAPNQQFEDQTIKCELSWTIRKLKGYLSLHYPCNPSTDEQKLIYSGQLLHDAIVLKDILRQYDEQIDEDKGQIHTVHLVFTPKVMKNGTSSRSMDGTTSSIDGLRHRNVAVNNLSGTTGSSSTINTPVINQQPTSIYTNIPSTMTGQQQQPSLINNCGNNSSFDPQQQSNEFIIAQQVAMQQWMQHAYSQYLNQYVNLISMGFRPESIYLPQQTNGTPQNIPFYPPQNIDNVISPLNSSQLQTQLQQPQQQQPNLNQPIPQQPQPEQPQQELQNRPQPRFPNIVQEEENNNRDWLDMFYALSRLMIFLTLVYFYSSPARCLVVLFVGISIYLYHMGFFRNNIPEANNNQRPVIQQNNNNNNIVVIPQQQPNNNNNIEENNNVAQVAANVVEQEDTPEQQADNQSDNDGGVPPVLPQQQQPQQQPNNDLTIADDTTTTAAQEENNRTSIISFIRTFVLSFFASLIPDHAL